METPTPIDCSVQGAPPLRVALLYSSDPMRHAALESCLSSLRHVADLSKIEILSAPLSTMETASERQRIIEEPAPDLLVLATDQSAAPRPAGIAAWLGAWIDQKHIAIIGVFGVNASAPLSADNFHGALAQLSNQHRCAYFRKTVFLGPASVPAPLRPADESILND